MKRQKGVKDQYLFTAKEINQKLQTINLFESFDKDANGHLDEKELATLYNSLGFHFTQDEICDLYGGKNYVHFGLDEFQKFTKDKHKLARYRRVIKRLKPELEMRRTAQILKEGREVEKKLLIPPTFDQMMTAFGQRVLHKQIDTECDQVSQDILFKPVPQGRELS